MEGFATRRLDFGRSVRIRDVMDADAEDETFDGLIAALEAAVDLCSRHDRGQRLLEIQALCREAAELADALTPPA